MNKRKLDSDYQSELHTYALSNDKKYLEKYQKYLSIELEDKKEINIKDIIIRNNDFLSLTLAGYIIPLLKYLKYNNSVKTFIVQSCFQEFEPKEEYILQFSELLRLNNTITRLDLSNNDFQTRNFSLIIESLKENNSVKDLILSNCVFEKNDLKSFVSMFKVNNSIKRLDIANTNIFKLKLKNVCKMITKSASIEYINLSNNDIKKEEMKILSEALKENNSIKEIKFKENEFGDEGIKYLIEAFESKKNSITNIDLSCCKISDEGMKYLNTLLKENNSIKKIDLSFNLFGNAGMEYLSHTLKENNSIQDISLCMCSHVKEFYNEDKRMEYLSEALKLNTCSITRLNLERMNIGNKQLKYLSDSLRENNSITNINLKDNSITKEGMKYFSEALKFNISITKVNLSHNKLEDDGIKYLSEALNINHSILCINLNTTRLGDIGIKYLCKTLKRNPYITNLNLIGNNFQEKGIERLSKVLSRMDCSIRRLKIEIRGYMNENSSLMNGLNKNKSLTYLNLSNLSLGSSIYFFLFKSLEKHTSLTKLQLNHNMNEDCISYLKNLLEKNDLITDIGSIAIKYPHLDFYIKMNKKKLEPKKTKLLQLYTILSKL
jgi:Ran GTPase-activating protein (RanGAP) involved in mRNA processing and transport